MLSLSSAIIGGDSKPDGACLFGAFGEQDANNSVLSVWTSILFYFSNSNWFVFSATYFFKSLFHTPHESKEFTFADYIPIWIACCFHTHFYTTSRTVLSFFSFACNVSDSFVRSSNVNSLSLCTMFSSHRIRFTLYFVNILITTWRFHYMHTNRTIIWKHLSKLSLNDFHSVTFIFMSANRIRFTLKSSGWVLFFFSFLFLPSFGVSTK